MLQGRNESCVYNMASLLGWLAVCLATAMYNNQPNTGPARTDASATPSDDGPADTASPNLAVGAWADPVLQFAQPPSIVASKVSSSHVPAPPAE